MSDDTLNSAIVGCGVIGPTHANALKSLHAEGARLVAFSDEVPARADALAAQYGAAAKTFEAILADPAIDAVHVCVPSGLHAALGVRALQAGEHVVVEKPMDITLAACDALLAAQRESGKRLAVISQHRFDKASIDVKAALDADLLGRLVFAEAQVPWYRTQEIYDSGDWRGTWALDGGGALMNQGVHTADLLRWLCGPVETVYAQARTLAHERVETEDVVAATLTFANGAVGILTASTAIYPGFGVKIGVYGKDGSAIIEGDMLHTLTTRSGVTGGGEAAQAHALQVATGGTKAATEALAQSMASDPAAIWGGAHEAQIADFIQCCRTGGTPIVDGVEGRKAVELVLAVYEVSPDRPGRPSMILVGIDPGTATTGYGVIEKRGDKVSYLTCGVITTPPGDDAPARLMQIYDQFNALLDRYEVDQVATERLFFTNNVTTGIPVGRALGVILLTLAQRGLPWTEYTPTQVKSAVVGTGRADKKQVQFMVTRLLGLSEVPKPDDAADALAIAICHAHSVRLGSLVKSGVRG